MIDADGYTTTFYDDATGAVTKTVTVVSITPNATITTSSVPDLLGRPVQTTDGNGNTTTIQYVDGLLQSSVTTTPAAGPAQKVVNDLGQGTITTMATVPGGSLQKVSEVWLDYAGRTVQSQRYDGQGGNTGGTYTTQDEYDDCGGLYWTQDAVGTITETDFDGLGRATNVWVGTSEANLTEVESEQYDNNGVGDGNLTQTTQYTNAAALNQHVTSSYFDWQDRPVAQFNGLQVTYNTLDNLGEATQADVYDGTLSNTNIVMGANGVPQPPANSAALRAGPSRTTTTRAGPTKARLQRRSEHGTVDAGNYLATQILPRRPRRRGGDAGPRRPGDDHELRRRRPRHAPAVRQRGQRPPGTIGTVVQSVATQYDGDSNPIFVTTSQLNPDGRAMRTSYVGNWYNDANQLTNTVNYGTNGGTPMSQRPADPPRAVCDADDYQYDAGGFLSRPPILPACKPPMPTTTWDACRK